MTKLMVVAGELSGDAHGGGILSRLKELMPGLQLMGVGGVEMAGEGLQSMMPIDKLQARGILEVVGHIPRHYFLLRRLRTAIEREKPDALLLIDYPGFNLRLAKVAKEEFGVPVLYYSSPQLWAWRGGRMQSVVSYVDKIIVLFPFEVPIYQEAGVDVLFLGHPLVGNMPSAKEVEALKREAELEEGLPVVAIMPGSRPGELAHHLPTLLEGLKLIGETGYRANYLLPLAPTLERAGVESLIRASGVKLRVVEGGFVPLLGLADLAIVASGTATLQVCMAGVPFFVVYRVSALTYQLAKRVAYVKHISIVNILAGRGIVPEVLQHDFTPRRVRDFFLLIASNPDKQARMKQELAKVTSLLGQPGAYGRAAETIAEFLQSKKLSQ